MRPTADGLGNEPGGPSASEKTLLVLEAAFTHARFSEIVTATGLAKATTHRILATLIDRQFVTVDDDGEYLPGPRILSLAGMALRRIDISRLVQPFVDDLVSTVHCTVHVGTRNGDEMIYLVRTDSDKPYRMPSRVGDSISLHSSGIGKVILAELDQEAIDRFVDRAGLPRQTARTITTRDGLQRELADIRARGYALDREENVPGVVCIATALRDHTGFANYGISISSLALEHTEEQLVAMSGALFAAADAASHALGYRPH